VPEGRGEGARFWGGDREVPEGRAAGARLVEVPDDPQQSVDCLIMRSRLPYYENTGVLGE